MQDDVSKANVHWRDGIATTNDGRTALSHPYGLAVNLPADPHTPRIPPLPKVRRYFQQDDLVELPNYPTSTRPSLTHLAIPQPRLSVDSGAEFTPLTPSISQKSLPDLLALSVGENAGNEADPITLSHSATHTTDDAGFDSINDYTLVRELGHGSFGVVMLAHDNDTNELRAIKMIPHTKVTRQHNEAQEVVREVAVMKKLNHKHIVRLYECIDDPAEDTVYLVMEYVDGDVLLHFDDVLRCAPLSQSRIRHVTRQLADALVHMHGRGVVHCDIKPDNILVDRSGNVHLTDFGVSRLTHDLTNWAHDIGHGSLYFASPEMLDGVNDEAASDMWAVGVTLFAMLFGCLPFTGDSVVALVDNIHCAKVVFPPASLDKLKWRQLVRGLLAKDPSERMTAQQLRDHPLLCDDLARTSMSSPRQDPDYFSPIKLTEDDLRNAIAKPLYVRQPKSKQTVRASS